MAGVLVHEWIAQDGGSENVLQAMSETFPDAELRCLWNDSRGRFDPRRNRMLSTWGVDAASSPTSGSRT